MSNDQRKFKKIIDGIEKNGKLIEKLTLFNDQKPVCVGGCRETNVNLYFCSRCDKSYPVCRRHFQTRQRSKICLVCETKGINVAGLFLYIKIKPHLTVILYCK